MKAIAITPGKAGARMIERPEPSITAGDEIKVRVLQVGICGTDREEVSGGRAAAPPGASDLVIGHEMLGQVVAVGDAVKRVTAGDHLVFTVRRGCNQCASCAMGRSDMCQSGQYRERGIKGIDGYHAEFVVDKEVYAIKVPATLVNVAVLTEPLSVVEKAIDEAGHLQRARCPDVAIAADWLFGRRCLVAGLGPVGLLAAMVLSLRGAEVYGLDVLDANSARPQWLEKIGGKYIDGRAVPAERVAEKVAPMDVVIEAAGIAKLEFNLLDALALNGVCVLTGIPGGDRPLQIPGAEMARRLVLGNQLLVGSVNASAGHFRMAIQDLSQAVLRWPGHVEKLLQHYPVGDFAKPMQQAQSGAIKEVVDWATGASTESH
ncbi:MAG TPA: glucose 1-dehydrogenase [Gemmatimonadales bacterium]|jgi:threonine dehydrogenase-like Zn-dependent dehydrogenase